MARGQDEAAQEPERGVAAVERALAVFNAFRPEEPFLPLHELAARTGLYKSTLLRILGTLERRGCIQRLGDRGYQLGPMLLHWASIYQSSLRLEDHVLPVLQALMRESGEGCSFSIRQGDQCLCLYRVDAPREVRVIIRPGDMYTLPIGATGQVLLAHEGGAGTPGAPPYILTRRARDTDVAALAAPVFGAEEKLVGAMTISGVLHHFDGDAVAAFIPLLLKAATALSRRLGARI